MMIGWNLFLLLKHFAFGSQQCGDEEAWEERDMQQISLYYYPITSLLRTAQTHMYTEKDCLLNNWKWPQRRS